MNCFLECFGKTVIIHSIDAASRRMTKLGQLERDLSELGVVVGLDYPGAKLIGSSPQLVRERWWVGGEKVWEMHES